MSSPQPSAEKGGGTALGRCQFYMHHKRRNCRFAVTPGKAYCGVHLFSCTGEGEKRVPCPLDPAQFVATFFVIDGPVYGNLGGQEL